jgi:integrase
MATIRKRVGRPKELANGGKEPGRVTYTAMVRRAGFPTRTDTFTTKKEAQKWATTVEAEMIEGRHSRDARQRRRTVGEAIDRYMEEEVPRKRGGGGMHSACLSWWKEKLGGEKLVEVTRALLVETRGKLLRESFKRADPSAKRTQLKEGEKPRSYTRTPATANRYMASLSHVFTMVCGDWEWLPPSANPFAGLKKLKESEGRTRHLSDDERGRLLEETAKDPTLHTLVTLALNTAARAGELVRLTWADVDLKGGRLLFRITKNAQPRTVWVSGEALEQLKEYAKVRQLHRPEVFPGKGHGEYDYAKRFAAAVEAAGITDFRFHDLRHTAATMLARLRVTEQQLRAIGGWKSNVVNKYVHLAAEDVRDAMAALANKLGGKKGKDRA